jgi:hypothetical protein
MLEMQKQKLILVDALLLNPSNPLDSANQSEVDGEELDYPTI